MPSSRLARLLPCMAALAVMAARLPVLLGHQDTRFPFELFSGSVATALLDGLDLDWAHLTIIPHIRGGALFGVLLAPLYATLGETTLVLKLVPLLWHGLFVALSVAVCQRWVSRSAALLTGLLWLLAPPVLAKLSVLGLASHLEAMLPAWMCLAAWCPLARRERDDRRAWARLGLCLGLSAAFHLQGLLFGGLLVGLLVWREPGRLLSAALPVLLAALVGWSPSLVFEGSDSQLGASVLAKSPHQSLAMTTAAPGGEVSVFDRGGKATTLLTHGLGPVLEFGPPHELSASLPAYAFGWALLLAALWGGWRSRQALLDLLRRPLRSDGALPDVGTVLALHALLLGVLFLLSGMQLNLWFVGTGMASRRLAPLLVSLLGLAALGLARRRCDGGRSALSWVLLAVLSAGGLWGALTASRSDEAGRLTHRGECYPWFVSQLRHHAGGSPERLLETVRNIDRGDRRFLNLRYRLGASEFSTDEPLGPAVARCFAAAGGETGVLCALTDLGRVWGSVELDAAPRVSQAADALGLSGARRQAFLHGLGLGVAAAAPRASRSDTPELLPEWLERLAGSWQGPDGRVLLEGLGFFQGFVFDRYNHYLDGQVRLVAQLPAETRASLWRGFGWGLRQRWSAPPPQVPRGLGSLDDLDGGDAEALASGLLAVVLPAEAAVLSGGR